jgi:acetoin utilization deacetylase AcuC-like enzyme
MAATVSQCGTAAQAFMIRRQARLRADDYHHGNGTQEIFYNRADVPTISIHADPLQEFPFFSRLCHETGKGGRGPSQNQALRCKWDKYEEALTTR